MAVRTLGSFTIKRPEEQPYFLLIEGEGSFWHVDLQNFIVLPLAETTALPISESPRELCKNLAIRKVGNSVRIQIGTEKVSYRW